MNPQIFSLGFQHVMAMYAGAILVPPASSQPKDSDIAHAS